MRKLSVLFIFITFSTICCLSQTYLKGNAAYWVVGITNVSVETRLASQWTFNTDVVVSPWKSINNNPFMFGMIIPEVRFYPKGSFNGFYAGGFGVFQVFKMSKWNYINSGKYQKGRGFGLGVSLGYEFNINEKWKVDTFAGFGWQNSQYDGYYTNTGERYQEWNGSGEWMPYKIGFSFAYKLGK